MLKCQRSFLVVTYDMGFLRCATNVKTLSKRKWFITLFKQFLETEMSKSPPIIARECFFKNQNYIAKWLQITLVSYEFQALQYTHYQHVIVTHCVDNGRWG